MNFQHLKKLTRLDQTWYGLPFIAASLLLIFAQPSWVEYFNEGQWVRWLWILPAFILARISGMAFNQLIDWKIDADNPRTKNRVIPAGQVTPKEATKVALTSLALFLFVCLQINVFCFALSWLAAFLISTYSYMKRIHFSSHFFLGSIHLLGPIMAYVAITGSFTSSAFFLGLVACLSIAGNDIIYALQDYDFDRSSLLHSIPSRLGIRNSFTIAGLTHFLSVIPLYFLGIMMDFPLVYFFVIPICLAIFFRFYRSVIAHFRKTRSFQGIESIFFVTSVSISTTVFFFILAGILL